VSRCIGLAASDREFPALTGRSGTQRACRLRSRTARGHSAALVLVTQRPTHQERVPLLAGFNTRASFRFTRCCWCRSLAV